MKALTSFHYRDHAGNVTLAAAGGDIPDDDIAVLRGDPRVKAEPADDAPVAMQPEPSVAPEPAKLGHRSRSRS